MFNPIDMLQAQSGAAMQGMAQQFGLSPDQTRRALEALMPAFAIGLQRTAPNDPMGLANLFGSPTLMQAVVQQASATSGVGAQVLRQMLPMMAGAVVASVVHMLLNQQAPEPAQQAPFPLNAAWTEMMKAFLPPADAPERKASAGPAKAVPRAASRAARPEAPQREAAAQPDLGREMFQQLMRTGVEVQEQNVRAMQGLFDALWPESGRAGTPSAVDGDKSGGR